MIDVKPGDRVRVDGRNYKGKATVVGFVKKLSALEEWEIARDDGKGWPAEKGGVPNHWYIAKDEIVELLPPDDKPPISVGPVTAKVSVFTTIVSKIISLVWVSAVIGLGLYALAWAIKHLFLTLGIIG